MTIVPILKRPNLSEGTEIPLLLLFDFDVVYNKDITLDWGMNERHSLCDSNTLLFELYLHKQHAASSSSENQKVG
jgi:hypothetical protein